MPETTTIRSATTAQPAGCWCQLIVWDPDNPGFDPDMDFLDGPNVPEGLTELTIPPGSTKIYHGRFLLRHPVNGEPPELPLESWYIEALDRRGRQTGGVVEFLLDRPGYATAWGPTLLGEQTPCETFARFQLRLRPEAPAGVYRLRARWPWPGDLEDAVVCTAEIRVGETEPEEEEEDEEDHTTEARRRVTYLGEVTPPWPRMHGRIPLPLPLPGAPPPEEDKKGCRCQLIVWESGDDASEPDVNSTIGQDDIPEEHEHLKEIEINRGTDQPAPHGRLRLYDSDKDEKATVTTGKWAIEGIDEDGETTDAFEFGLIEGVGDEPDTWESRLMGKKSACNAKAYFRFRAKDSAPPGEYTVRASWPVGDGTRGDPVGEPEVTCEVAVTVVASACTCTLEALEPGDENSGTVAGHVESRDGELGVCISTRGACAYPETVMLELSTSGVSEKEPTLYISARFADDAVTSDLTALELKQIDLEADSKGVRDREMPDGRIPGKWKDSGWKRSALTVGEPCESRPPLRIMVRLSTDPDVLKAVGSALHEKVGQAVEDGDTNAYENAELNARITVRQDNSDGLLLCEYTVPIKVRGGIWVKNSGSVANDFAGEVMKALRAICGRGGNATEDFDWLEGKPPRKNAMGVIIPTPGFCDGSVNVAGHPRGRELIRRLLCGSCCAVIMPGNGDNYTPYFDADSFPKGLHPFGNVPHWGHRGWDCSDRETSGPRSGGILNGITGTGIGTGGTAKVNIGTLTGGTEWKLWRPVGADRWGEPRMVSVSGARVLAHESAHLILGCEGKLLSGIKAPLDKLDELNRNLDKDSARQLRKRLTTEFNTNRVTGTFNGREYDVPLKNFGDLGEYDAIMEWENPIAAELAPNENSGQPRFSH